MDCKLLEEFTEFVGLVLCKHGTMEGEILMRAIKGRRAIRSEGRIMKEIQYM